MLSYPFLASFLDIAETPVKTTQKMCRFSGHLQESNHSDLFWRVEVTNHLQTGIPICKIHLIFQNSQFMMRVDFHLPPKVLHIL